MVATVRNLTSSSATSEYFRRDGGYYAGRGEDATEARAKQAEHRRGSAWYGKGAAALGLAGREVATGTFETVLQGRVPGTGVRLGRRRDGQHEHRPGFDITFSAPKSVSLAALLPTETRRRGDRAAVRAHDEAVRATLGWIEETLLETRGWDPATRRRPRVQSPSMVAALFRHVASRNRDPQLHTHAVVANMTRDAEGKWKSVEPTQIHRNARLIGAYYRNELARRLAARGYAIVPAMAGRIASFEIAGYGRALREAFSTRRREIVAWVDERGLERTSSSLQTATFATRRRKAEPVQAVLRREWLGRLRSAGLDAAPRAARSREPAEMAAAAPSAPSAIEIVARATERLEERQPVFAAHELEALALAHSPGSALAGSGPRGGGVDGAGRPPGGGVAVARRPGVRDRADAEGRAQGDRGDEGGYRRGRAARGPGTGGGPPRRHWPHAGSGRGGADDPSRARPDRRGSGPGGDRQDDDAAPCPGARAGRAGVSGWRRRRRRRGCWSARPTSRRAPCNGS